MSDTDELIKLLNGGPDDRMKLLEIAAAGLIQGKELPAEVKRWLGVGLLRLSDGKDRTESFEVAKPKEPDFQTHALRWALVERKRTDEGMSKEKAYEAVANTLGCSVETIERSWKIQNPKQREHQRKVEAIRANRI